MPATLRRLPGHGSVREDTHVDAAVDPRPLAQLRAEDLLPFAAGIAAGAEAVMMAHVSYPAVDVQRSEEHTSELQSLMRISYAVFCLKKKTIESTNLHENRNADTQNHTYNCQ